MMRLRATVQCVTGKTTHLSGVQSGGSIGITDAGNPTAVEIVEQDGAIYLLRLDDEGRCIADTWHESVEAAKAQANFEYSLEESDWTELGAH